MRHNLQTPVLVLNKYWTAFRVISAARAFTLLYKGVAEAIDVEQGKQFLNYDFDSWADLSQFKSQFSEELETNGLRWVKCVRGLLAVPDVIRLVRFDQLRRMCVRLSRRNIYMRDNFTCQYCGQMLPAQSLNLDHVLPRSRGGCASWNNLVCSCVPCNTKKGALTPVEAGMTLRRRPTKPTVPFELPKAPLDSWKHFISAAYWNVELKND